MKKLFLFFLTPVIFVACKKESTGVATLNEGVKPQATIKVNNTPYDPNNPLLKNANTDFEIGAAINENDFGNSLYTGLAGSQYNSITAENEMKFQETEPYEGDFRYNMNVVNFAKSHGINRVHGHAIMWYRNLPSWVAAAGGSATGETRKQIYRSLLYNHIYNLFTFYYAQKDSQGKPIVKSWDVVNEAFNAGDGNYRPDSENVWAKELGAYDAVRLAFLYARQIAEKIGDTNLKLFYNDFGHEYSKSKTDAIFNMVNDLKVIKVNNKPIIDGVGLQMHTFAKRTVTGSDNSIDYAITKMAATGLLVHISELDIRMNNYDNVDDGGTEGDQKYRWFKIPQIYRARVPSSQRWGITLWNIGDADSWRISSQKATLYDVNYNKKSVYQRFYEGLNQAIDPI
nr:endo-1,4-beta-xylanase [uncultured Pedobacter sp.]